METSTIQEILSKIICLQSQGSSDAFSGCDKPFLGPSSITTTYNTRPVQLYNTYTATPWEIVTNTAGTPSNIFRIESLENDAVTVRLLTYSTETSSYTDTNTFATITLNSIGAIHCFPDTYVAL